MQIIPAVLVPTFSEFQSHLQRVQKVSNVVQVDIMDGKFVPNRSFSEIQKINGLDLKARLELHLLVEHPLAELSKWSEIKNVVRVIFHVEAKDSPELVITDIKRRGWEAGIALNPETPLEVIFPYLAMVDEVLFMTVNPGRQGAKFLPAVGKKIRQLVPIIKQRIKKANRPLVAVDGGINSKTIVLAKSWNVDVFCVGSALTMAPDVSQAYKLLKGKAGK